MWSSSAALDEFRAEVSEANAKLERLEDKLRDLEIEQSETKASMEASQRTLHIQTNSTQAEALRLKGTLSLEEVLDAISHLYWCVDELAALEDLHLWHTSKVHADLFEFVYASRFHVHIPCVKFKPLKDQIRITKTKEMLLRLKDQFPRFTDLSIKVAQQRLASSFSNLSIKQVGTRIDTACDIHVATCGADLWPVFRVPHSLDCSGSRRLLVGVCATTHALRIPFHQISCLCRSPPATDRW